MANPLYRELMDRLEKEIKEMYAPNDKLPSEREMVKQYNVSRSTIRLALGDLEQRGIIYRLHGKGTFVSSYFWAQASLSTTYSFSKMTSNGFKPSTKNISLGVVAADEEISGQLNLELNERVYELTRLRMANGEPFLYSKTYLPKKLFPDFVLEDVEQDSLYNVMQKKYHQISVLAFEDIKAVNLDARVAKILDVNEGDAAMKIYRRTINDKNVSVEYTKALARGDKFIYQSKQYNNIY
ncbi:GntR family transcriptional regulator [Lactobacillus pasteurii]|uniref:UbiC transcription regulator-associated n=1 Tax=Lactobacillus pasteurii DSM 23907 = CRBIP 24.76 TaxID=1423790 RepID=I7KKJ2_9LACO|nr:GntR family transcriptional regulator [Lactobacillus pasteurii]TDG77460.1 hypothetical protein C5L33_000903 [Lactobacillus pasteurii]CCI84534.1 UbiC transcription regulator-associated [Lactobacillus pasteurii DSM 23907 = CRBIP 24.76]